jgi:hypothetical protein
MFPVYPTLAPRPRHPLQAQQRPRHEQLVYPAHQPQTVVAGSDVR